MGFATVFEYGLTAAGLARSAHGTVAPPVGRRAAAEASFAAPVSAAVAEAVRRHFLHLGACAAAVAVIASTDTPRTPTSSAAAALAAAQWLANTRLAPARA